MHADINVATGHEAVLVVDYVVFEFYLIMTVTHLVFLDQFGRLADAHVLIRLPGLDFELLFDDFRRGALIHGRIGNHA